MHANLVAALRTGAPDLGLFSFHLDQGRFEINLAPIQPLNFCAAQTRQTTRLRCTATLGRCVLQQTRLPALTVRIPMLLSVLSPSQFSSPDYQSRIRVAREIESKHDQATIVITCDGRDREGAQPVVNLRTRDRRYQLAVKPRGENVEATSKVVDVPRGCAVGSLWPRQVPCQLHRRAGFLARFQCAAYFHRVLIVYRMVSIVPRRVAP